MPRLLCHCMQNSGSRELSSTQHAHQRNYADMSLTKNMQRVDPSTCARSDATRSQCTTVKLRSSPLLCSMVGRDVTLEGATANSSSSVVVVVWRPSSQFVMTLRPNVISRLMTTSDNSSHGKLLPSCDSGTAAFIIIAVLRSAAGVIRVTVTNEKTSV